MKETDRAAKREGPSGRSKRGGHRPRLTRRDQDVVVSVFWMRALTRELIQELHFTRGGRTRCQYRLTWARRLRLLDTLERRSASERAVYILSRRSTRGLALLRQRYPEEAIRRRLGVRGPLEHTLEVNRLRIRLMQACQATKVQLSVWLDETDLEPLRPQFGLLPDGYFEIRELRDGCLVAQSYFVELDRSMQSVQTLQRKLARYEQLIGSGESIPGGTMACDQAAILVAIMSTSVRSADARRKELERRLRASGDMAMPIVVAYADDLLAVPPAEVLYAPLWRRLGSSAKTALLL